MNKKIIFLTLFLLVSFVCSYAQETDSTKTLSIDEITVNAYRTDSKLGQIPYQLKVLQAEEIKSLPVNGLDELLKKNTAIDLVQYPGFNTSISMRGFSPNSGGTLVLIDGIPASTENIATISLEDASQVEILKGPFSSFFGSDAMSGVINITTKRSKDKIGGGASVSYGSFKTYKIAINLGGKITDKLNFDFWANTRAQKDNYKTGNNNLLKLSDTEKHILDNKSFGKEYKNTQYNQYAAGGRIGLQLNKNWEINLNQQYWQAKDIQTHGTFWGIYGATGKDIGRWSQSLNIEGKAGNHNLRLSPYYSNENSDYYSSTDDDSYETSNYNFKTYGFILQDAIAIGAHRLIFGVDNLSKKYTSKQWSDAETVSSPYQPDYLDMATGVYLQAEINLLNNKLNASIGGRYDNINFKLFETPNIESVDANENYNVFNPNLAIQYKFINNFKVHAAIGKAFLAPDAFKVAGNYTTSGFYSSSYRGNPDLNPETSVTYDFGLAYNNYKLGLYTDITYFSTKYKDMIVNDYSNMDYITFANESEANMDGLEIMFNYDFGALSNYSYSLKLYLDYTHLYNAKSTDNEGIEEEIKYVRMNKAAFGIIYNNLKGFMARINARYIGERLEDNWIQTYDYLTYETIPYQTENGEDIRPDLVKESVLKHPDFLIVDFSASYTFKEKYSIGLTVNNLFDDNYTEKDAYYMPGRNILGTLSIKF